MRTADPVVSKLAKLLRYKELAASNSGRVLRKVWALLAVTSDPPADEGPS